MTQYVDVEIYADIICPWCYIGKKRLDAAFEARPHVTPRYIWRCFLLNPTMPSAGMDRQAYLIGKFGNAAKAVYGRIADAGLEYLDKPYRRFVGDEFEQETFFIEDPNGNVLEMKTMVNPEVLFKKG